MTHAYYARFQKDIQQIHDIEELEKKAVIQYVRKEWLERYFEMKLKAQATHMPKIIASYSDTPVQKNNTRRSSTEDIALIRVSAEEWLEKFHTALKSLPEEFKLIIQVKYLECGIDGKPRPDDYIYQELGMTRNPYYEKKKEAIYWMGLNLLS